MQNELSLNWNFLEIPPHNNCGRMMWQYMSHNDIDDMVNLV